MYYQSGTAKQLIFMVPERVDLALSTERLALLQSAVQKAHPQTASADVLIGRLRHRALSLGDEHNHIARMLASDEQTILTMLAHVDARHGGRVPWLHSIGITPAEIARLPDRLCA